MATFKLLQVFEDFNLSLVKNFNISTIFLCRLTQGTYYHNICHAWNVEMISVCFPFALNVKRNYLKIN